MDSFYLVLNSEACKDYYSTNNGLTFKNKLLNNICLEGTWNVALCDIQIYRQVYPPGTEMMHSLWIYSDIVIDTQIGDLSAPLLKRISLPDIKNNWLICDIKNFFYVPIRSNFIECIKISIKADISSSYDTFIEEFPVVSNIKRLTRKPTSLTLHFKKIL